MLSRFVANILGCLLPSVQFTGWSFIVHLHGRRCLSSLFNLRELEKFSHELVIRFAVLPLTNEFQYAHVYIRVPSIQFLFTTPADEGVELLFTI